MPDGRGISPPPPVDVITIDKTDENFRLVYDTKGRFVVHRITSEEAAYKLCRVKQCKLGEKGVPYIVTHDGRTLRYPDPMIKTDDTVMLDIESGKVKDFVKFQAGNLAMVVGGRNAGRVGILAPTEKHKVRTGAHQRLNGLGPGVGTERQGAGICWGRGGRGQ